MANRNNTSNHSTRGLSLGSAWKSKTMATSSTNHRSFPFTTIVGNNITWSSTTDASTSIGLTYTRLPVCRAEPLVGGAKSLTSVAEYERWCPEWVFLRHYWIIWSRDPHPQQNLRADQYCEEQKGCCSLLDPQTTAVSQMNPNLNNKNHEGLILSLKLEKLHEPLDTKMNLILCLTSAS